MIIINMRDNDFSIYSQQEYLLIRYIDLKIAKGAWFFCASRKRHGFLLIQPYLHPILRTIHCR